MPNSKYPRNPSGILTTAFKMGIAITLALARDRATGKTRPLYFGQGKRILGMAEVWKRAKEAYFESIKSLKPDASVLLRVEHAIRRSFSRILLKTSVRYGNNETKRVKREEGKKGYLNILWDYAGSRLRDVVKPRYIFPKPTPIERSDGSSGYGYHGSSKTPLYPLRHNHLPELDFGDMIRSPLMELARQCLKYGVPLKEAKKYIDALLLRLLPFMDYVYTGRRSGRSNYVRDGLKELRAIVSQIEREYGTRNGLRQSITAEIQEHEAYERFREEGDEAPMRISDDDQVDSIDETQKEPTSEDKVSFLNDAITDAIREGVVSEGLQECVSRLLDSGALTADDSLELVKQAREQSRRIGVQLHDFVAKNFQSPFSLKAIIFHGSEMAYDDSGLMLFSEVSIDRGRGRLDLVLAHAKELPRVDEASAPIVCEPLLIADLKTKSAFDFDIYGIESRSKNEANVVSEFILERRALTEGEWECVISNTPLDYERAQLDEYEASTCTEYRDSMRDDPDAQEKLTKAVIVVDSFQDWKSISEAILPLVLQAYRASIDGSLSEGDLLFPERGGPHITMKMLSVVKPSAGDVPLDAPLPLQPFDKRVWDNKEFILYLTVPGRGSPAQSAATIAERWHGLTYLHSLAQRKHRDIIWLDLVGEYDDPVLRKKQFRLRYQPDSVRRFFKRRIRMTDLSSEVRKCIVGGKPIGYIQTLIRGFLKGKRKPVVVVSGWEDLRRSTPDSTDRYLDEVATTIVQVLPPQCTVLWFARPVPIAQNSKTYSSRCVAPFYQDTIWQNLVDSIVWNVAMPPDRMGARYPTNDHKRVVIIERPGKDSEYNVIEVKPLRGWGEDFRSGGRRYRPMYQKGTGPSATRSFHYNKRELDRSLELIPHLQQENQYSARPTSDDTLSFRRVSSKDYPVQDMQPMLSFRPTQIYVQQETEAVSLNDNTPEVEVDGRVKILLPIGNINRRREYREMTLGVLPQKRTTRPPVEHYLKVHETSGDMIALAEIRQLRSAIRFLKRSGVEHLAPLLDELSGITGSVSEGNADPMNVLRLVRQTLESSQLSKEVWDRLLPFRLRLPRRLTKSQRGHLEVLQKQHPDILVLTGNHLFLLLLASLGPFANISYTTALRSLWEYVQSWHLTGLGYNTEYPRNHKRGRSVLDRHRLLKRLEQLGAEYNRSLNQERALSRVRFGQLIALPSSGATDSIHLWMLFQRKSGLFEMNAALLNPRGLDPSHLPLETLHEMVSERTYWSESDLSSLSWYADLQGNESRTPVMIADQRGIQTLFSGDDVKRIWTPVAGIEYTTRRFEDVTLVRTISLAPDPYLQAIPYDNVRRPIHRVEDMTETALLIMRRGLERCIHATCRIALDQAEKMYRVTFLDQGTDTVLGDLLIHRTVDLLEVLRRPDTDCNPVVINGKQLIWNRFRDVILDDDTSLIRPWVNRRDPFPGLPLALPASAEELLEAQKGYRLKLEVYHDPWTCPLRHITLEAIQQNNHRAQSIGQHFLFRYVTQWAEPEPISNEPGTHHGSCWKLRVHSQQPLTPELEQLMDMRFTDAEIRALLTPQELVYWSEMHKAWVTHTFAIVVREKFLKEIDESWHLRALFGEAQGRTIKPSIPGAYLQDPDRWDPFFTIEPEYVVFGLMEKGTRLVKKCQIDEENIALRTASDVRELLDHEMSRFLLAGGVRAGRRLLAAVRSEIEDAIEIYGIQEEKAQVTLDSVVIGQDSAGGRVIYVVLDSDTAVHKIAVTGHLHTLRERGRITREVFVDELRLVLEEFNLSKEDWEQAVEECLRLMRKEHLIKR